MTKGIKDYSKTIIFIIESKDINKKECMIEHATGLVNKIQKLKKQYKDEKSKHYNKDFFKIMRENGGWENYETIILEEYTECKNMNDVKIKIKEWKEKINLTKKVY